MRVHYEMEVSSFAADSVKKALEYLVYLLFADNLSHFSRLSRLMTDVSYFDDVISRHLWFLVLLSSFLILSLSLISQPNG